MRRIIGLGETVLDVIFRNDRPQDAIPGGSSFNSLISLGRTAAVEFPDVAVSMVTETGDDHISDIMVSFMKANGVGAEYVTRRKNSQSHISMAFLDSNNDAHYEFYKDHANAGLREDIVSGVCFNRDDIVLLSSFFAVNPALRHHIRTLLTAARDAGAIIYYDINFRSSHIADLPEVMGNILENCSFSDFVRGSSDDFLNLFETGDGRTIYDEHIAPLCRNFILTRGPLDTEIYRPDGVLRFPVRKIDAVSTIGAGDNFNAGFIYSMIKYGFRKEECPDVKADWWNRMIPVASAFAAAACLSLDNYVERGFRV